MKNILSILLIAIALITSCKKSCSSEEHRLEQELEEEIEKVNKLALSQHDKTARINKLTKSYDDDIDKLYSNGDCR